ncbi:MAG TPA: Hpt domain-containing protein, partial [Thermomicrobiales bacterium]|nr:Hpt domain-containing protein [Thermomicrobiales bacterium]
MAKHGESELIENFITELQPYLALIDQAVEELARLAPDTQVVGQAAESLAIIRDASTVLNFEGLVRLTSALQDTFDDLLDSVTPDPDRLLDQARAMAIGIHRYMDALEDGNDTDELVTSVLAPFDRPAGPEPEDAFFGAAPAAGTILLDLDDLPVAEADPELREIFEEEATELIASFTRGALMLVSAPDRPALLSGLRRDAHTLKGAANMTGFPLIGSLGASIETLLDAHIDGDAPVERETLGVILSARKLLTGMLASLDDTTGFAEQSRALNERAAAITARIAPLAQATDEPDEDELLDLPAVTPEDILTSELVLEPESEPAREAIDELLVEEPADTIGAEEAEASDETVEAAAVADAEDAVVESVETEPVVDLDVEKPVEEAVELAQPEPEPAPLASEPTMASDLIPFTYDAIEPEAADVVLDEGLGDEVAWVWDVLPDETRLETESAEPGIDASEPAANEPEQIDEHDPAGSLFGQVDNVEAPDEEPELDVYEMAAEIAMLARLRTSLLPQNATFFPTDASGLSDDIDALTAEIVDTTAGGLPLIESVEDEDAGEEITPVATAEPELADPIATIDAEPEPSLAELADTGTSLGYALLDLAFEDAGAPETDWPDISAADTAASDERMQQELRETFAVEAAEYADSLTLAAMALERDPESSDALRELTRVLHTLKGAAAAAGYDEIGEHCHAIEDDLAAGADITRAFTDRVLELASTIEQATTGATTPRYQPDDDATAGPGPAQPAARTAGDLRVEMRRLDDLLNLVGELVINRSTLDQRLLRLSASLDELSHMTERLRRSGQTLERVAGEASLFGPLPAAGDDRIIPFVGHDLRHEFDTLEMDRYTDLDVLARELGEVASDISAGAGEVRNLRGDFETVSTHQRRLTNEIQDDLMDIRMVPLATLSPLLHRVVRRVAQECDKDVDLVIEGSEIAFDKALVDALGDALLHLLRNAVDHGIESPAVRWTTGKPERGRIVVRAWQDRGNAVVEVIDDGRGVDTERLVERARNFGFISAETVSEAEALQLMFLPGFSTRDSASSVSGRGVGLDAVREAVERVKGRVTVDSKPGAGTIFQLRLPVMLAVAQAFLVEAGGRRYAVPLADVDFVADRRQARLSRVGNAALVEINEALIPAIDLASRLAGDSDRLDEETGWLLVTRTGGDPRAMRVDSLHGQQEIVVKPLGRYLTAAPGVTGATILGDGQIALIIDVADVTGKRTLAEPAGQTAEPTPIDSGHHGVGTALIVDDSLSVRRVLARTLERHGWTTIQAHDGVEALEKV